MSNPFDAYDDDLVGAWVADAMARKRMHDVYGPNVEGLDEVDLRILAEWDRRCALRDSARPERQADHDVECDSAQRERGAQEAER